MRWVVVHRRLFAGLLGMCMLAWAGMHPSAALAISCPPIPRYVESISVEPSSLPDGLTISAPPNEAEESIILVVNETSAPLYLLGIPPSLIGLDPRSLDVPGIVTPPGLAMLHQVIQDRVLSWDGDGWQERRMPRGQAALTLRPASLNRYIRGWESVEKRTADMPAGAASPAAQYDSLSFAFDGRLLSVPIRVTYAPNPRHNQERPTGIVCTGQFPEDILWTLLRWPVATLGIIIVMYVIDRHSGRARRVLARIVHSCLARRARK
jgi:hypothetical protein